MQSTRSRWGRLVGHITVACALVICAACGGQDEAAMDSAAGNGVSAVDEYVQFATAGDAPQEEAPAFVAEGLRKLAGALGELGLGGPELTVDLRVTAEHVLLNPASPATSEAVRDVLLSAADALGDGSDAVRGAAESITTDRPLDAQAEIVARCFREAAGALERRTR